MRQEAREDLHTPLSCVRPDGAAKSTLPEEAREEAEASPAKDTCEQADGPKV